MKFNFSNAAKVGLILSVSCLTNVVNAGIITLTDNLSDNKYLNNEQISGAFDFGSYLTGVGHTLDNYSINSVVASFNFTDDYDALIQSSYYTRVNSNSQNWIMNAPDYIPEGYYIHSSKRNSDGSQVRELFSNKQTRYDNEIEASEVTIEGLSNYRNTYASHNTSITEGFHYEGLIQKWIPAQGGFPDGSHASTPYWENNYLYSMETELYVTRTGSWFLSFDLELDTFKDNLMLGYSVEASNDFLFSKAILTIDADFIPTVVVN